MWDINGSYRKSLANIIEYLILWGHVLEYCRTLLSIAAVKIILSSVFSWTTFKM
jgi:hypothetical protein